jgi:hypothetical protein
VAAKAHVVQSARLSPHVDFDVAQEFPRGQLREGHREELMHAREILHLVLATMGGDATAKRAQWQMRHQLREDELALVHDGPARIRAKGRQ